MVARSSTPAAPRAASACPPDRASGLIVATCCDADRGHRRRGAKPGDTPMTTSAAFPRQARLLTPADFQRVFAKGRRFNAQTFQLIVRVQEPDAANSSTADPPAAQETPVSRLGLTVARRVARRAVDRNRIKRIARDSFRHHRERLDGLDLVLVARPGAAELSRSALHDALKALWRQAETLKPAALAVKLAPPDATATAAPVTPATREPSS